MVSIGVLGFVVWAHHMVRVNIASRERLVWLNVSEKDSLLYRNKNRTAVKQEFKGQPFVKILAFIKLSAFVPTIRICFILMFCRVNKIKVIIEGSCAAMFKSLLCGSSILFIKSFYTCGSLTQTMDKLKKKVNFTNNLKTITDPKQNYYSSTSISYVVPAIVKDGGTRSSLTFRQKLKVFKISKGAVKFVRKFSTLGQNNESKGWLISELQNLRSHSIKNNTYCVNRSVNTLLSSSDFWAYCYKNTQGNHNVYPSGDRSPESKNIAMGGIHLDFFTSLGMSVKAGKFHFRLARNTPTPELGESSCYVNITDSRDKIIEEGMAVILGQIANHRFYNCSFESKKGKPFHDAINYIQHKIPSGQWAIEGDISKCFDKFNHKRLVSIVRKRYVNVQIFSDLLYKVLKVKIVLVEGFSINKTDTLQSSALSSTLFNIYLHEFDSFILEGLSLSKYRLNSSPTNNYSFVKFIKPSKEELLAANHIRVSEGKLSYWKFLHKMRALKLKESKKLKILRLKPASLNRKIAYIRSANNFILFVWGTKKDCLEITHLVGGFLKSELALSLPKEKTKIVYLRKNKVKFLGLELWQSPKKILSSKKKVDFSGTLDKKGHNIKFRGVTFQAARLRVTFSVDTILKRLVGKGLVSYKAGKFFPTSYKPILKYDVENIVKYLKMVFRGLSDYYAVTNNWYDAKILYNYFGKFCVAMTIAHKTKSKTPKVLKKYGNSLEVTGVENTIIAKYGSLSNTTLSKIPKHLTASNKKFFF